ncbi:hypothetical protein [Kitasatospora viridis]|uniref:Uncharacterized protein n=1 Tax=Kitasatospora viridis TaxID=281105 RepID=A0A561TW46_9ACTN|nr:hypothetical protein [Kitasatospora viridis]TWF91314.1 hypothetical protein FHX73_12426 [Kitasatospora viridis]
MTIALRAREAAAFVRAAVADPRWQARERALAVLRVAALLAVPRTAVTAVDDERRAAHPRDALLLTATDPADPRSAYRFSLVEPRYTDEPLHLLGRCPDCAGEVPVREVRSLADLAAGPLRVTATTFLGNPGHRDDCRNRN